MKSYFPFPSHDGADRVSQGLSRQSPSRSHPVKMSDRFQFKWNDFHSTVSQSFGALRREAELFDVTLVSEDEVQMSAHKLVLSASSSFFKSVLRKNPQSHPLIYLTGVTSRNLLNLLNYVYQGQVELRVQQRLIKVFILLFLIKCHIDETLCHEAEMTSEIISAGNKINTI